jgi:hypothetical protein
MANTPGTLATMCGALADKSVNVLAFMSDVSDERAGMSRVRMIVDKTAVAKKALDAIGYAYSEEQVLGATLDNRPGTLGAVAKRLGDAGINIDYAYVGAELESAQLLLVLAVSDFERGRKLVR